jgi:hypothetical protein
MFLSKTLHSKRKHALEAVPRVWRHDGPSSRWYALLNYLYTDKVNFLPLGSATPSEQPAEASTNTLDELRSSPKSMYRLASKVRIHAHSADQLELQAKRHALLRSDWTIFATMHFTASAATSQSTTF